MHNSHHHIVAYDHTFQIMNNYTLNGAKAMFTGMKRKTKEVVSCFIVPSTKLYDASHALISSIQRRTKYKPATIYTDTCPSGVPFWKSLFGELIACLLGLFHFVVGPFLELPCRTAGSNLRVQPRRLHASYRCPK